VEHVLAEVEEVRVDLVALGDADQVQVPFKVDRRPFGRERKSGRARSQARPEDEKQRGDEGAVPNQILSLSLLALQAALPFSPEAIDLANSA
jgi:hypothetical protein